MNEKTAIQTEPEVLTFSEICQAERLWHDTDGLQQRYGGDFNLFLHGVLHGEVVGLWDDSED